MKDPTKKLVELCQWLEAQVRPYGYHVAATGSALYGHPDLRQSEIEDLDIVLYRHSGWLHEPVRPFNLLQLVGFRGVNDLSDYEEFEGDRRQRCVLGVKPDSTIHGVKIGVKIDFLFIDMSTDKRVGYPLPGAPRKLALPPPAPRPDNWNPKPDDDIPF
jgi:hypothetical protein